MEQEKLFKSIDIVRVKLVREKDSYYGSKHIRSPEELVSVVRRFLEYTDREVFLTVNLSTANTINSIHVVSVGTLDKAVVHPREVFKAAILSNASNIALAHNHPSGDPNPSQDDIQITAVLVRCGEILGIKVLDHIIIGEDSYLSFAEQKLGGFDGREKPS
jgi:DNA repair protein RadC